MSIYNLSRRKLDILSIVMIGDAKPGKAKRHLASSRIQIPFTYFSASVLEAVSRLLK